MNFDQIVEYLPFIIPLALAEIILAVTALVHVLRHPNYKFGNKAIWIVVVLVVEFFGPIIYFVAGRGDE